MIASDVVVIAALAVFVLAWWVRSLPSRPMVLALSAAAALVGGTVGAGWLDRWQDALGAAVGLIFLALLGVNRLRNRPPRSGLPFISGSLFALLAVPAIALIFEFPVNPLPKPSGPYAVGVRNFELDDQSRKGVFHAKPDEPRRLLIRVWYPAGDVSGHARRPYFTIAEAHSMARSIGESLKFPPFFTYTRHVLTNGFEDAALKPGSARLPVVFYSHGYGSFLGQNTVLMEDLASHGYVVFSVQHAFDSTATLYPNGDVAPVDPELTKPPAKDAPKIPPEEMMGMFGSSLDQRLEGMLRTREKGLAEKARLSRSGGVWLADELFVHDRLQAGDVPDAIKSIAAASDFTRIGEMGMSFGGANAGTVCLVDHRCAAGVNLDGSDFPFQAFDRAMPVPFLMFHSDMANLYKVANLKPPAVAHSHTEFSYEPFATAGSDPNVYRVMLKGAQHIGLSDFSLFMRRPVRDPILGTTPKADLIGAQNDFVLGFFDRYLRGRQNGFPKPQLEVYAGWATPMPDSGIAAWWAKKTPQERAAIEARIARDRVGPEQLPAALSAR